MKYKVGDVVYWHNAPSKESGIAAPCLIGVAGVVYKVYGDSCSVTFADNDHRGPFNESELISEELYNSPLYKALL